METEIKLYNREGGDLRLRYVGGKFWIFVSDRPEYFEKFCRFILGPDNKTIESFDPPGGPFISIGDRLGKDKKYLVTRILGNLVFEITVKEE
jgi:hypothetical protein